MKPGGRVRADVWIPAFSGALVFIFVALSVYRSPTAPHGTTLAGQLIHDFGVVELDSYGKELRHTFLLQNQSRTTIRIQSVTSTCGCTNAAVDKPEVPPGDALQVSAILHLTDVGPKQVRIIVATDQVDHEILSLTLGAIGHRARELSAVPAHLVLRPVGQGSISVSAIDDVSDEPPGLPRITLPTELAAQFAGWKIVHARNRDLSLPARWMGEILIKATSDLIRPRKELEVLIDGFPPLRVTVEVNAQ
jgi:hypothetical protein